MVRTLAGDGDRRCRLLSRTVPEARDKEESMRATIPMFALALSLAAATAQAQDEWKLELRPFAGASIPTGAQRDYIRNDILFGAQIALELRPTLHAVSTYSWTPTGVRYQVGDRDVHVLQYDVGLEFGRVRRMGGDWRFEPFVGLGGGGRTYLFDAEELADHTCSVGYVALGTEFQIGRTSLRLEGRDNLFCYRSPVGGARRDTRNDLGLTFGLAYHFR